MRSSIKPIKFNYSTAKFRNTEFKLCKFEELKFIDNPEPKDDEKEGYGFITLGVRFPILKEDSNNAHSDICADYTEPMPVNFRSYDKNLHKRHRVYQLKQDYQIVDIYHNKAYCVDLNHCTISLSTINKITFDSCNFNNTTINKTCFNHTQFLKVNFSHSLIENCTFGDVEFLKERPSKFIRASFINVIFNYTMFSASQFVSCTFTNPYFDRCHINGQFIDCHFNGIATYLCTTPSARSFEFNLNYFRALCQNCTFE